MRIAIYSRKSIDTDIGESIKNQISICKEYFLRQSNDCKFEVFQDEGFSGSNTNRPSFQRMMELAKIKQFDIIAVYKLDRIARNIVDFVNIYDELERTDVKLVSITEGFDPSTPGGKMMMLLLASFAEMERMNIAQRVKDNMRELAKMGRWSGGTPPIAYRTVKSNENGKAVTYLEVIEEKADDVKEIFSQYADGYSTHRISKNFKEKGLNYPNKTILNMLSNPTYLVSSPESIKYLENDAYIVYGEPNGLGFLPYNRRPKVKGKKTWNNSSKFVGISKHKAIIDAELWIQVQQRLKDNAIEPRPRESSFTYLSGLVKCECGSTMYICPGKYRKDATRWYYFRCSSKRSEFPCDNDGIRVDRVEQYLLQYLKGLSSNKEELKKLMTVENPTDVGKKISKIKSKISTNDKSINNLVDKLMLLSNDASNIITKKIEDLAMLNNSLKEELLKCEREEKFQQRDQNNVDIFFDYIVDFLQNKDFESDAITDKKRFAVKLILKQITWDYKQKQLSAILNI